MLRTSIVSPANVHRCACGWKLCHAIPRSRLNTYHRIRCPASAWIVGVLPTNVRPLKQYDAIPPPSSVTVCVSDDAVSHRTCPPGRTLTSTGSNAGAAVIVTVWS
jgi:hypothetical protein